MTNPEDNNPSQKLHKSTPLPPSRVGKKPIIGYFDPPIARELKMLAARYEVSIQSLLGEAIADLLEKYKKRS